jgi:hypothetical protein
MDEERRGLLIKVQHNWRRLGLVAAVTLAAPG